MKLQSILFYTLLFALPLVSFGQAPPISWSKVFSGPDYTIIMDVAIDQQHNVVAVGRFVGTITIQTGSSTISYTSNGKYDIFVVKLDSTGNYLWSKHYGGLWADGPSSVQIDINNDIIIGGTFDTFIDFHPSTGTATLSTSDYSAFVLKLNSTGSFIWVKEVCSGTVGGSFSKDLITDSHGNIYSCGIFSENRDFNTGSGSFFMTSTLMTNQLNNGIINQPDYYIQKLDVNGNFKWAISGEGTIPYSTSFLYRHGIALTLDNNENIYLIGDFTGNCDFNPGSGTINVSSTGKSDAFILKLDSIGGFQWVKTFKGNNYINGSVISAGNQGEIYCAISFFDTVDLDPGVNTQIKVSNGGNDLAIIKLDTFGNLMWANQFGSSGTDRVSDIKIDRFGYLFVALRFTGTVDFDPSINVSSLTTYYTNISDFGIVKYNSNGGLEWCDNLDLQPGWMEAYGIDVSDLGEIYYGGFFIYMVDLDMGSGFDIRTTINPIYYDAPLVKLQDCLPSTDTLNIISCSTIVSPSGNFNWDSTGTYFDTLLNASGCDSLLTVYLIFDNIDSQTVVSCDSFQFPISMDTWDTSGIFLDTLTSSQGCDSIIRYDLTIYHSFMDTINLIACDSFVTMTSQNIIYTSGFYIDSLTGINGCDSTVTVNLTVNYSSFDTVLISACEGFTSPSGNYTWTSSGTYMDTIPNKQLCDSILQINLTIFPVFDSTLNITRCMDFPFLGTVYTSSGTYYDTLLTQFGCDSTFVINFRKEIPEVDLELQGCEFVLYNGTSYTQNVSFRDTVSTILECDTIYNVAITVFKEPFLLIFPSDTFIYRGQIFDINVSSNLPIIGNWNNGLYLNCNYCNNNISFSEDSIKYYFTFQDYGNCFVKDTSFILNVKTIPETYIPNAFTPGNDGLNDVFEIKNPGVKAYYMHIYDRWGKLVFESSESNQGWDGYIDGRLPNSNTYFSYQVVLEMLDESQEVYVGSVLLISK